MIFPNKEKADNAVKEFQGWELNGSKLMLHRLVSQAVDDSKDLTINTLVEKSTVAKEEPGLYLVLNLLYIGSK